MTFKLSKEDARTFESGSDLLAFLEAEEKDVVRIPVRGMLKSGAQFGDDKRFGVGDTSFAFNERGFDAVCDALSVPSRLLRDLNESGLATDLLNERIQTLGRRGHLEKLELVCRESDSRILGTVSSTYVGYSNRSLIRDIAQRLGEETRQGELFPDFGKFTLKHAYSFNTVLHLRLVSKEVHGRVKGRGGKGDDITELGFEASNSMTGGRAVRLSHFVLRLVCANGMTAPISSKKARIIHAGHRERFQERLDDGLAEVARGLGRLKAMVEQLGATPFVPEALARRLDLDMVFSILPGPELVAHVDEAVPKADFSRISDPMERKVRRDAARLAEIPRFVGGAESRRVFDSYWRDNASMFDFINVFTEQAKSLAVKERVEAEARAGELATWIARNKRHFS